MLSLTDLCDDLDTRPGFTFNDRLLPSGVLLPALRWMSSEGYNFGEAYALASTIFMKVSLNPAQQIPPGSNLIKDVLEAVERNQDQRDKRHLDKDSLGAEIVVQPYEILPRRIWDIR